MSLGAWFLVAAAVLFALACVIAMVAWSDWCEARAYWEDGHRRHEQARAIVRATTADLDRLAREGRVG